MEGKTTRTARRAGGDQSHLPLGSADAPGTKDGDAAVPLLEQVQVWLLARADLWALQRRSEPCTASIGAEVTDRVLGAGLRVVSAMPC